MSTGERLKEERERLGLTQEKMGAIGGVQKRAQINYEKGERAPDSNYLAGIALAGADVLYILTGQRSRPTSPSLSEDARALLDDYQQSDTEGKKIIRGVALQAAQAKKAKRRA